MLTEKVSGELEMLGRHLIILKCVVENEPIGILKLAEETKIPSHKVRYSLRVLEHEGLIAASAPGAVTTERTKPFLNELESMIEKIRDGVASLKKIEFSR
jgi:predicted transcriptional regulator